jgi:hypothetical protein
VTEETLPRAAGNGLTPGDSADPRDGPFTLEERAEAADALFDEARWFVKRDRTKIDVLALRLQVGRGRTYLSVCRQFKIMEKSLQQCRLTGGDGDWPRALSELDRRHMARRIHLAGLARRAAGERVNAAALKAASDWRVAPPRNFKPIWTSLDDDGPGAASDTLKETFHDNAEDDPYFHERQRVREQLEALIRRLDHDIAASESAEGSDQGATAPGKGADGAGNPSERQPA